jgi:hypothetical protein
MKLLAVSDPQRFVALTPLLAQVDRLFGQMDQSYAQVANHHGFVCQGCDRNCCQSLFFHHTYTEWIYLHQGLERLPPARRQFLLRAARDYLVRRPQENDLFCPLSDKGRCMLYAHRPMICRLHGIAHVMTRPDGQRVEGPGCPEFDARLSAAPDRRLDRTPFYAGLAALEKQVRQAIGIAARLKMTVAQMIATPLPFDIGPGSP